MQSVISEAEHMSNYNETIHFKLIALKGHEGELVKNGECCDSSGQIICLVKSSRTGTF